MLLECPLARLLVFELILVCCVSIEKQARFTLFWAWRAKLKGSSGQIWSAGPILDIPDLPDYNTLPFRKLNCESSAKTFCFHLFMKEMQKVWRHLKKTAEILIWFKKLAKDFKKMTMHFSEKKLREVTNTLDSHSLFHWSYVFFSGLNAFLSQKLSLKLRLKKMEK